ncbi:MAG: hypothetical protein JWP86_3250, partial [Phenylobacterium sp.]|nr:hypothetical protein [Phenylobacterium sp.]
ALGKGDAAAGYRCQGPKPVRNG